MKKILKSLFFLFFATIQVVAQNRTITGVVTSQEDGGPIPGVSILVSGTKTGTQTGLDGRFSIEVPPTAKQLEFEFVGYAKQKITIGKSNVINVILVQGSKELKEVVVTALGFQVEKDKLGTSQSTVKGDALMKSGETSVLNALSSKASGVQIARSGGDPGASTYIQIRGQSTITGDLQPLFVIDGVPVSNSSYGSGDGSQGATASGAVLTQGTSQQSRLNDLNPDDIENIEVLKGTAAAALWGTRAANGVVIITTKRGKANSAKINISLNSTYSIDVLNKSVPLQTAFGQGEDGIFIASGRERYSWGDKIADRSGAGLINGQGGYVILPDGSKRYPYVDGTVTNPHGGQASQNVYDHAKELFHNGYYLDNTLTLSGGDDKTLYYVSLSNLDQKGILKANSDYHRKSFNINADRHFGDNLKISTNLSYVNTTSNRAQQGSNLSGLFLGGLRTPPDFDNSSYQGTYVDPTGALFPNRQIAYRNPIGANVNSGYDNPFWSLNQITSTSETDRFLGSFETKYDPKSWLSFILRAGVDYYSDSRTDNYPVFSSTYNTGSLTLQEISELQFNSDFIGKVTKPLSKNVNFTGLLGFNYNNRTYQNMGATAQNFILPDAPFNLTNSAGSARFPFNEQTLIRTTATYTQLSFELYDQLFADLTGRAEQASTFANTFFYPSISLAWQFNKLKSLESLNSWLSFGKLRASYGEVGVQPKPYLNATYYYPAAITEGYGPSLNSSSSVYGSGGYLRGYPSPAGTALEGNPDLKPERKREIEFGTDLRFLSNKLIFSAVYYANKTTGAIFPVQVPATTGFTFKNDNAAEMRNRGVELELGANEWYKNKGFSISSNATWSTNRNKVLSLKGVNTIFLNGFSAPSSNAVVGQQLGVFWGTDFLKDGNGKLILDANGFPQAAPNPSVIGDPNPDWIASLGTTFRYKQFSMSVLFDHVQGGDVWNGTKGALINFGTHASTGNEIIAPSNLKAWDGSIISAGATFRGSIADFGGGPVALNQAWYSTAGAGGGLGSGFGPVASQFIEKGTRTRLREITLSYLLTGPKFKIKTKLQSINFSITGRNLILWTSYSGIDPETNLTGVTNGRGLDYFNNPSTRSYLFSIKVNY
jgi:TonB-linked SusC/RagA family outer membrane protein